LVVDELTDVDALSVEAVLLLTSINRLWSLIYQAVRCDDTPSPILEQPSRKARLVSLSQTDLSKPFYGMKRQTAQPGRPFPLRVYIKTTRRVEQVEDQPRQ
jgi:hypothetical protein